MKFCLAGAAPVGEETGLADIRHVADDPPEDSPEPGTVEPGTSHHVSGFQDLLPTLAELTGASVPADIDGLSFAPTLLGRTGEQATHEHLYWEFTEQGGKRALLEGSRWKLVQRNVSKEEPHLPELYDLETDPGETRNLAEQHPERVRAMVLAMDGEHVAAPVAPLFPSERQR